MPWALSLAFDRAGRSIAARMAMMAMTTSSSINVNPPLVRAAVFGLGLFNDSMEVLMQARCQLRQELLQAEPACHTFCIFRELLVIMIIRPIWQVNIKSVAAAGWL